MCWNSESTTIHFFKGLMIENFILEWRVPSYLDHFDINYIILRNFVNKKNLPNHKILNINEYSIPWNKYFKIN